MAKQDAAESNAERIEQALEQRFGERIPVDPGLAGLDELARVAGHRTIRRYLQQPVAPGLLRLLCACALSAPSKSDLQQADIVVVSDRAIHTAIADMIPDMPWIHDAPVFLVFLADGMRMPKIAAMRGKPFPNDHFDLLFNATVDGALVMATFLRAAEAVGLACCPISVIRDNAAKVSELLHLPEKVIPIAGMAVGWPAEPSGISARLNLDTTLHENAYDDRDLAAKIDAYDHRRHALRAFPRQRAPQRWGEASFYGWSEDKARQYADPARADFGAFVRAMGFKMD